MPRCAVIADQRELPHGIISVQLGGLELLAARGTGLRRNTEVTTARGAAMSRLGSAAPHGNVDASVRLIASVGQPTMRTDEAPVSAFDRLDSNSPDCASGGGIRPVML
jgi:hypothetical protein